MQLGKNSMTDKSHKGISDKHVDIVQICGVVQTTHIGDQIDTSYIHA